MSEFLAEASVLVRPITTSFRAELEAQLVAVTRGVAIPVPVVPIASTNITAVAAASQAASVGLRETAIAAQSAGIEAARAAQKTAPLIKSYGQLERGAGATALSLLGVRGATLAASGSFLAGAAAVAVFAKAVSSAANLEQELNVFRVTARATAEEMVRVRDEAIALGRDISLPAVSAGDAAEAITELAKAGLGVEDSLAGARGILQLASAAQIDNAAATELAAGALNAFGLAGDEAVHVADLLTNASIEAQGSIQDMGLALQQSSAIASLLGISLEDTITLITELARAGLRGSDAGTGLRVALTRLIAPSKEAQKILERLNITLRDAQGNLRPDVFVQIGEAFDRLGTGKSERARLNFELFGQDAQRIAGLLERETRPAFDQLSSDIERSGSAAELAGARAQGFAGQVSALANNLETLGLSLGQVAIPALSGIVQVLNGVIGAIERAGDTIDEFVREVRGDFDELNDSLNESVPGANALDRALSSAFDFSNQSGIEQATDVLRLFGLEMGKVEGNAPEARNRVLQLFKAFTDVGGGETALNQLVLSLDEMADRLSTGDKEAQRLSAQIRAIIREIQKADALPPTVFDIVAKFDPRDVEREATAVSDTATRALKAAGGAFAEVGVGWLNQIADGMKRATPDAMKDVTEEIQVTLSTQLSVAEARGNEDEVLRLLRERQARLRARLDALLQQAQTKEVQKKVQETADFLTATNNEIASILQQQQSDAEKAANAISRARSEADQAIIDAIDVREQRAQNAVLAATLTESRKDDLQANLRLRDVIRAARDEIRKTVQDAKVKAAEIAALTTELIRVNRTIQEARRQLREEAQKERAEERARLRESLALDVEIAQATGNRAKEIQARENEIAQIEREIRQQRRGSLARKRLIAELRKKQAELRELRDENKKIASFTAQMQFEFLQAQQGFAANLFGNLIPSGSTGGLVGNVQPVSTGIEIPSVQSVNVAASLAEAKGQGFSAGQGNTVIDVLRRIERGIRELNRSSDAPEARYQRAVGSATMDGAGGGTMDVM